MLSRRRFVRSTSAALGALACRRANAAPPPGGLIASIERQAIAAPPVPRGTWFHPRACLVGQRAFMTLQPITGSDFFGPVHWTTSDDLGKTWSEFRPVPPLGWVPRAAGGHEAVCDVTPEFHPRTGSVLALGHNVFYATDRFDPDQPSRRPVYAVWKDGAWGPRQVLEWDDPRGSFIYSNNCGQRVMLPDGDVMMSFTFGAKGEPRRVCGVRCTFDGARLAVAATGPALENPRGRGLLEPSLTRFAGRFFLTMRAEDDRGYVAVSDDGLHYEPKQPWTWDDGEPLVTSTTQQHWLQHADGLFLVYVRKDASNAGVFRWRAPLWLAQVDVATLRLVRATERVVLPLVGDGVRDPARVPLLGNFGVCTASPAESWVTDGSWCPRSGHTGELQLARVRWTRPNLPGPRDHR
jgi:hypothetical protein